MMKYSISELPAISIFIICCCLLCPYTAYPEIPENLQKKVDRLVDEHHKMNISDETFMNKIDTLSSQFLGQGITLKTSELRKLISPLEDIAWSHPLN